MRESSVHTATSCVTQGGSARNYKENHQVKNWGRKESGNGEKGDLLRKGKVHVGDLTLTKNKTKL